MPAAQSSRGGRAARAVEGAAGGTVEDEVAAADASAASGTGTGDGGDEDAGEDEYGVYAYLERKLFGVSPKRTHYYLVHWEGCDEPADEPDNYYAVSSVNHVSHHAERRRR